MALAKINQIRSAPLNIPGCVMWLDGTDPLATGLPPAENSLISTWVDKSGRNNNAFAGVSPSYRSNAINGMGAVLFNGSSWLNMNDLVSQRSFSVYIVIRRQAANSGSHFSIIGASQNQNSRNFNIAWRTTGPFTMAFFGSDINWNFFPAYTGNVNTEPAYIIGATFTPGTRRLLVNGTIVASDGNTVGLLSNVGPFIARGLFASLFNGFIGEIIYYNGVPVDSQRQYIEGYLAWKWRIQSRLPSNHPFFSLNPVAPIFPASFSLTKSIMSSALPFFNPRVIPGCFLWLDGADRSVVGVSGSNVTAWNDKSGLRNNLTTISSPAPTYNSNTGAIRFTANNGVTTGTSIRGALNTTYTNPISTFIVCSIRLDPNTLYNPRLINFGTNGTSATYFAGQFTIVINANSGSTPGFAVYANNNEDPTGSGINNQTFIPTTFSTIGIFENLSDYSGTTLTVNTFLNGNTSTYSSRTTTWIVAPPYVTSMSYISLGANTNGSSYVGDDFSGDIYEVLSFSRTISTTERQQIEGYLAWKWGVQANLPSNHPFQKGPPTPYPSQLALPQVIKNFRPPVETITRFTYTGSAQTYTVPQYVRTISVYLWGAGGGRSATDGGAGAFVSGTVSVTPGSTYSIVVGKSGNTGGTVKGTMAQGAGGAGSYSYFGGGGFSGIFSGATLTIGSLVAIAGGGGTASFGPRGGSGGVLIGGNGTSPNGGYPGTGGTQTQGGTTAGGFTSTFGTQFFGGDGRIEGPGGGGGYYGGGGSDPRFQPGQLYAGSGGGSSFTGGFASIIATEDGVTPNGSTTTQPGGISNTYYLAPYGRALQHGYVVIRAVTS
jgi:hypothetical protein